MAGKIIADTLEHSTAGSVTTDYVVNGSAKSWVNLNGTGTIAIRDSLNVASLTDNGTGSYDANYTNNMNDTNYANIVSGGNYHNISGNNSTSYYRLNHYGSSHTLADSSKAFGSVFGDLA